MGHTDAELLRSVGVNGNEALEQLYERHARRVHGLAFRVTRDAVAAEDVTQEVFLELWDRPERYDATRASFPGYLAVLTHNRAVSRVRREVAMHRREVHHGESRSCSSECPGEGVTASLVGDRVRTVVAALPPGDRDAVVLAYFGSLSYRQVAANLGIPEGTAKSRLRRALLQLAVALRAEGITTST